VERVTDETGALDVLVDNAAVAVADGEGRPSAVRIDTTRQMLDVNFSGALRGTTPPT
jgi:NADP-dependent 3-hydroxy acid dehydrogenase YdfG